MVAKLTSEGTGRVFNVLLSIIGARVLGPAAWGSYWSAFGVAQLAALGTDLGGHLTMARDVARSPGKAWASASAGAAVKVLLIVIVSIGLVVATPSLRQRAPLLWPLAVAALALSIVEWLGCFLRGHGRVSEEAALLGVTSFVGCVAGALTLVLGAGILGLAVSQAIAMAACLAAALFWIIRILPPRQWNPTPPDEDLARFLGSALPTGVAILISMTSWRLVYLISPGSGDYAVAQRLLEVGRFLPVAAAAALFPSFVGGRSLPPGRAIAWLVAATAAAAAILWIPGVAGGMLTLIFGTAYAQAAPALAIFGLALPFMSVNAVLTHWLIARGHVLLNAALSALHLTVHLAWLVLYPATRQVVPEFDGQLCGMMIGSVFTADRAAAGLLFAEIALTLGTLLAWRRFS